MAFEIIPWIISAFALLGTILNSNLKRTGFYIWAVTNMAWVVIDWQAGLYAQSVLFFIYFLLAIKGIITWGKKGVK